VIDGQIPLRHHFFQVSEASLVKRCALSTEIGQAFCRLMLHDYFGIVYFAHLNGVIRKGTHLALGGLRVERSSTGDIPDYLCARKVSIPSIAAAKGRFSTVSIASAEFQQWRDHSNVSA